MCGICGFAGFSDHELLARMTGVLRHRGPDDVGYHEGASVGLGCRRLSIIDLAGGHQPIYNEAGTVAVVQNGEIYNYKELRVTLEGRGHRFRTQSDTEVLAHAYEEWGEEFFRELNGDFAIAIWDDPTATLILARDRLGSRPLYYCQVGSALLFASELKSLLCWSRTPRDLDPVALDQYLTLRYVPGGKTLFAGVRKLPPGCWLKFGAGRATITPYWSLPEVEEAQPPARLEASADQLYELLSDSVRLRMRSDVPVGAYLSGGLDSSLIVALMSQLSPLPVRTFALGFGTPNDELDAARALAQRFGTEHQEVMVGSRDYELLPKIVWHLDEPIGDAITIPTYRLAQAASTHVKVAMSGEGADEVFGGYIHHLALNLGTDLKGRLPKGALRAGGALVKYLPASWAARLFPYPAAPGERGKRVLRQYLDDLSQGTLAQEYLTVASVYRPGDKALLYTDSFRESLNGRDGTQAVLGPLSSERGARLDRVMAFDLLNWLPDYTLLKQDKLGFANSLELRAPYLDYRVVELAARLPADFKVRRLTTKRLLRHAARRALPPATARAPKRAFYMPVEKVFGTDFDQYARDILGSARCRQRGIISPAYLSQRLGKVRTSELLDNKQLIALLVLELWFQTFVDGDGQSQAALN